MVKSHKDFVEKLQDPTYENESKINQKTVDDLKNEIDRLDEENNNLKLINSEHKKLNAKLQKEIKDKEETELMKYHTP
tara:strand:- start:257 stop:490 length:234 start_codon:yes stop_codon:yes gene_type:complete